MVEQVEQVARKSEKIMPEILSNAAAFLHAGIGIIPVHYKEKTPDGAKLPGGKWESFKTQLPTTQQLTRWFSGPANYGVLTTWQDLIVLDFDDSTEYVRWLLWIRRSENPHLQYAYQVTTSRGVHVYVRLAEAGSNRKIGKIDVKTRGYVLGPGSIHPTGVEYRAKTAAFYFPRISTLSDILPVNLLIGQQQVSSAISPQILSIWGHDDPWVVANNSDVLGADLITLLRQRFKLQDFFIQSKQSDNHHLMTLCPFHDDQAPSFWIDTRKEICNCFKCNFPKPLDVINFYGLLYGLSNRDAIWALQKLM